MRLKKGEETNKKTIKYYQNSFILIGNPLQDE
jgi:hypothetical protein